MHAVGPAPARWTRPSCWAFCRLLAKHLRSARPRAAIVMGTVGACTAWRGDFSLETRVAVDGIPPVEEGSHGTVRAEGGARKGSSDDSEEPFRMILVLQKK
jgi:hypothetical protein